MLRHEVAGERLHVHPERALWWADQRLLVLADVHLGKASSFRKLGVPIPHGTTRGNFARLTALVEALKPKTLVVLGDLVHDRRGLTAAVVAEGAAWRDRHAALEWLVVAGNHDRRAGELPREWRIENVGDVHDVGPFTLRHDPPERCPAGRYVLAGHVHPAVQLLEPGGGRMKAACFWFGRDCGVLPAFGKFTGTHVVRPRAGDGVFVVGEGEIVRIATHR